MTENTYRGLDALGYVGFVVIYREDRSPILGEIMNSSLHGRGIFLHIKCLIKKEILVRRKFFWLNILEKTPFKMKCYKSLTSDDNKYDPGDQTGNTKTQCCKCLEWHKSELCYEKINTFNYPKPILCKYCLKN